MMKTIIPGTALFLLAALFLTGCSDNSIYDRYEPCEEEAWDASDIKEFKVEINDTFNSFDFWFNVRATTDYPYSNLYVFMDTKMPDGTAARDTIEVFLADNSGKWLGKGIGKVKENAFLLRRDIVFPVKGDYLFRIEQAMREERLKGVTDVGIRISRSPSAE